MPFIGNKPSAVPLTSADIADGIITTAKIADSNITSVKITDATIVNGDIANATIALAKLSATGTADATTFLRGDNSWGSAGATAGQVIQVLSAYDSTGRTTTSTSFVTGSNTLSVSITPSSASNKILIFVYTGLCRNDSSTGCYQTIYRNGSTNLGDSTYGFQAITGSAFPCSYSFLDSPSTTSSTTYQVYFRGAANTARLNQQDNDGGGGPYYKASITCMEIKG